MLRLLRYIRLAKTGVLKEVNLVLERFPATSIFLSKTAGLVAEETERYYNRHASSVLVAHKTADFTCHPVSKGDHFDAPRSQELEAIGVVVSAEHPPTSTFLTPVMADHLLKRSVFRINAKLASSCNTYCHV